MTAIVDDVAWLDATAQADLVRRGEVTPLELVDAAIERIERLDPVLNAVIIRCYEDARARAAGTPGELPDGPFRGVPFLVKDLGCPMAGVAHHAGMRFLRDLRWVEERDAHLVRRFRAAGLVALGRTNTPEVGLGMTTEPMSYGPTRNPWDTSRSSGGSSGGSAAAVASGMVAVAHGGDGGGSLRIPASQCGLVGLKVSRGRVSTAGDDDLDLGLSVHGVLTRSVRDTAALLDCVVGAVPGDPHLAPPLPGPLAAEVGAPAGAMRVGFVTELPTQPAPTDDECVAGVRATATLMESLGHTVEESHPAALDEEEITVRFGMAFGGGTASRIAAWGSRVGRPVDVDQLEPSTRLLYEVGKSQTASTSWRRGAGSRASPAGWSRGGTSSTSS